MATRLKPYRIGPPYGGVNKMLAEHVIGDDTATVTDNWTLRSKGLTTCNGWEKFTDQILTDGAASPTESTVLLIDQFFKNDGSSYLLGFTNDRVYQFNETGSDLWVPITPGTYTGTTVGADSAAEAKTLFVAATTGFNDGDTIIIDEGGAKEEEAVVDSITAGVSLNLLANLTNTHLGADTATVTRTYAAAIVDGYLPTSVDADSASGQKVLNVASTLSYSPGDNVMIAEGDAKEETGVIDTVQAGVSITLEANLANTHLGADAAEVYILSASGQTKLYVSHTDQFTAGEAVVVGIGTAREEVGTIASVGTGAALILDDNLTNTHTADQADKVYRLTELTLGTEVSQVDVDNNADVYYFTDGVNSIQTYTATGTPAYHSDLGGLAQSDAGVWPEVEGLGTITASVKAKYIRAFEGFIVIAHLTEEGDTIPGKIRWSQINDATTWVNEDDGTGQAGAFLFSGADFIMGLHQMKRELLIYRERSIEAMSYIGLPDIFGFRRAETGTGLVAPRAIADFGDKHIFCGPDNIWEYNGISLVAIGDAIKDNFFDSVDPSQLGNVAMFFLEETDELWLTYSTTGDFVHDKAYIYNTIFQKWSGPRDVDGTGYGYYRQQGDSTWDGMAGTWDTVASQTWDSRSFLANAPLNMMGNDDGLVFTLDQVGDSDGGTISKRYESKRLDLGAPHLLKSVQRLRVSGNIDGSAVLSIYLGVAMSSNDDISWNGPYSLTMESDADPYVYMDLHGRFFKVRVDTDDALTLDDIEVQFYARAEI